MKIPNPMYDVVFKYLMENNTIAISLLSVILGVNIVSLKLQSQEITHAVGKDGVRVYRLDFKAVIKTASGELRTILIEIQKSKNGFEVHRFQTYLGLSYLKGHTVSDKKEVAKKATHPITVIYLLGFRLKEVKVPFLKVERQYLNGISNRKLKNVKEDFVERLSHDLYAIQIPRLKMQARTEVESMLDVFNQNKYKTSDKHILEYTGNMSNPNVQRMVKHLNRALITDDYELLHQMLVEDEIEQLLESKRQEHDEALAEKDAALLARKLAIEDKEAAVLSANQAVLQANQAVEAKDAAMKAKDAAVLAENAAMKAAESERTEKEYWKALFESEKQKNQDAKGK